MLIPMKTEYDCGRVACANYLDEVADTHDAEAIYREIEAEDPQPTRWPVCDFWDSPGRWVRWLSRLTGHRVGAVDDPTIQPAMVLLRLSWTCWHWVVTLGAMGDGRYRWHDGRRQQYRTIEERFPGAVVVLAIAPGAADPLPWYWGVWWYLTRLFCRGVPGD